jgi:predicted Ser/Thr protein kinase
MIGTVIGSYRVVEKLGEGGMGTVYRAIDDMLEREVAIKLLRPELAGQPEIAERFRTEAVILAKLNHPNIATLYGLVREQGGLFMAMEFVHGETLDHLLARTGKLPADHAVSWCCQVLDAVEYAHRLGVVHRDLKPANLMVTEAGVIKVMDFGIARVLGTGRQTRSGHVIGTAAYMSPEQIRGQEVDGRSDIYALAIVLYELLTGRVPFVAEDEFSVMTAQVKDPPLPPRTLEPTIPEWLDAAIVRALAKPPAERFQTAAEFRGALETGLRSARPAVEAAGPVSIPPARTHPPTPAAPLPSPHAVGRTRLAEERATGWRADGGPAVRPTRLAGPGESGQLVARAGPEGETAAPTPRRSAGLTWRHLAGAAALLLILCAVPLAWFMAFRHLGPAAPAGVAEKPAPAAPAQVAPVAQPEPARAPQATASDAQPPPQTRPLQQPTEQPLPLNRGPGDPRMSPTGNAPSPPAEKPAPPAREKNVALPSPAPTALPVEKTVVPATEKPVPSPSVQRTEEPPAAKPVSPEPVAAPKAAAAEPAPRTLPALAPVTYGKVKLLVTSGKKSRETDVMMGFEAESLNLTLEDTRIQVKALPYRSIVSAVYSQSKQPRWKEGAGAAALVGVFATPIFFMKSTKHWLTIQTKDDFAVLRLDKDNYKTILPAFEVRTGVKVEVQLEK